MDTRRITVALDGSTMAEATLTVAESLASRSETVLTLVRAVTAPDELGTTAAYLEAVAARLRDRGFPRVQTVPRYGPPAAVILEAAHAHDANVIVMATTEHGVAETVVRGTQTPVFLVRVGDAPRAPVHRRAIARERVRHANV